MKKINNQPGFTLIEIILVLGVIAILLTLSIVSLTGVRQNSRDTERLSNIKEIQAALELYRASEGSYPTYVTPGDSLSSSNGSSTYMMLVPHNPPLTSTLNCTNSDYVYTQTNGGTSYTIEFCLEKSSGYLISGEHCATPAGITNATCAAWIFSSVAGKEEINDTLNEILIDGETIYVAGRFDNRGLLINYDQAKLENPKDAYIGTDVEFFGLTKDKNGDLLAAGYYLNPKTKTKEALLASVKKGDFGLMRTYTFGNEKLDEYYYDIARDESRYYYYLVGATNSEGSGLSDGLIVKYDADMKLTASRIFGRSRQDYFRSASVSGDYKYIYVVGDGGVDGYEGSVGLINIFADDLSIINQQYLAFQGKGNIVINKLALDWKNSDLYLVGYTTEEGQGKKDALIIKLHGLDKDFTVTAARTFGGAQDDSFTDVEISNGYIYASGETSSEGAGGSDGFVAIFDDRLETVQSYTYGSAGNDIFNNLQVTDTGIYAVGSTPIGGKGDSEILATKMKTLKTGTFNSVASGLTSKSSSLIMANSSLTVKNNDMVIANSASKEMAISYSAGTIGAKYYRYLTY